MSMLEAPKIALTAQQACSFVVGALGLLRGISSICPILISACAYQYPTYVSPNQYPGYANPNASRGYPGASPYVSQSYPNPYGHPGNSNGYYYPGQTNPNARPNPIASRPDYSAELKAKIAERNHEQTINSTLDCLREGTIPKIKEALEETHSVRVLDVYGLKYNVSTYYAGDRDYSPASEIPEGWHTAEFCTAKVVTSGGEAAVS